MLGFYLSRDMYLQARENLGKPTLFKLDIVNMPNQGILKGEVSLYC
jgi:hypothetical protein